MAWSVGSSTDEVDEMIDVLVALPAPPLGCAQPRANRAEEETLLAARVAYSCSNETTEVTPGSRFAFARAT